MRRISAIFLIGIFYFIAAAAPTFAANQTCTERLEVCSAYCEKTYHNSPKCAKACREFLETCLATGCWESKVSAKRCGFGRR